jgi:hypothetical protein
MRPWPDLPHLIIAVGSSTLVQNAVDLRPMFLHTTDPYAWDGE